MRVIVAGSRTITDSSLVFDAIEKSGITVTEVISGGARGVDTIGWEWALLRGIPTKVFKAEWFKYGQSAGPRRNREMANYCGKDAALILIWDGASKGSSNMKKEALRVGMKVHEVVVPNDH